MDADNRFDMYKDMNSPVQGTSPMTTFYFRRTYK